jgi:hypothetical protein
MALQYGTTYRTASMTAIATAVTTSGVMVLYAGTKPADCATPTTGQAVLATWTSNATQFGTATAGVLTVSAPLANPVVGAAGTAAWFGIYPTSTTNSTDRVIQGDVAVSGSDWNITSTTIAGGQNVSFTSMTITAFGA